MAFPTSRISGQDQAEEHLFADLLEQIGGHVENGDSAAAHALIEAHPEHADRLRQVLPAIQALAEFDESCPETTDELAVDSAALPEKTLGDFRIIREVGRGGMGVVYEAEQVSLDRRVALKVLPYAALLDARQLERFKNEARVAASLHHNNIVPVYTVGSERGVYYYAMQFIDGRDLAEIVEQLRKVGAASRAALSDNIDSAHSSPARLAGPTSSDTAPIAALSTLQAPRRVPSGRLPAHSFRTIAEWIASVADALAYAHSLGVVHRDIKPANLLLDQAGTIWISDFGLARLETAATLTAGGDLLGTLRYMSPELARGDHTAVNARTDIYALGVTLYELLTLQPAFTATDRGKLLRQIHDEDPRPPRRINPTIPADLETIVLKAISKDAASRYATAQDTADDLRRFLEHKPIHARRPTLAERATKWARRHVALISVGAASLAVVAVACVFAVLITLWAYRSESEHRAAAVANLRVAADSIDRMLSRVANERYYHGDLAQAETVAVDATQFYEQLLTNSDDPDVRFRAAEAYRNIASIWQLIGQYEKIMAANERTFELVRPLVAASPNEPKYLAARGRAYLGLGNAHASMHQHVDSEQPFLHATADFHHLIDHFSDDGPYREGLAATLNGLGLMCSKLNRWEEAETYYQQAIQVAESVPEPLASSPEVLTNHAGTLSNWAILAHEQGRPLQALELLEKAIVIEKRSLEKWPSNPVARDFLYAHYWNMADASLSAGRVDKAVNTVESMIQEFPDRLQAYQSGAQFLLRCAELAEAAPTCAESAEPAQQNVPMPLSPNAVAAYRQRAHELVAEASVATNPTPEVLDRFAWFLLTCKDKSLRDAPRALELAKKGVHLVPKRFTNWLTLALACYRLNDLQHAKEALENSIELYPDGRGATDPYSGFVGTLIEAKLGHADKAREWYATAAHCCGPGETSDANLVEIAIEAKEVIDALDANAGANPTINN